MTDTREQPAPPSAAIDTVDAVIVGAGFAGLYMLHKLRQLGFSAVVFEAADGRRRHVVLEPLPRRPLRRREHQLLVLVRPRARAGVGVERALRDAAGDPALRQPRRRPLRPAPRHQVLAPGSTAASFDESAQRWSVTTDQGDDVSAQHLVMAVGCLSTSKMPEIPGIDDFRGNWYHTGHWPHEGVDFTGQRVGVIGTGSSAIQSIPIIAEQADAPDRVPADAELQPAGEERAARSRRDQGRSRPATPSTATRPATSAFGVPNPLPEKSALEVSDEEREATYDERASRRAASSGCCSSYNDLITDKAANDTAAEYVRQRIRQIVDDPDVAETLCADGPPDRHQAAVPRHRLLRDVQPCRTSSSSTSARRRWSRSPRRGVRTSRAGVRVRQHRVRHRLRRHDRVAGWRSTSRVATACC